LATKRVEALDRALSILERLNSNDRPEMSVTDLSNSLGIAKGTIYRFLATFQDHGYVEQDPVTKNYRLGLKLLELGRVVESTSDLRDRAMPLLRDLSTETGENVNLSVLDKGEIVYLARVESRQFLTMQLRVGSRLPAHVSSMGKAMLAYLPDDVREEALGLMSFDAYTPQTIKDKDEFRRELKAIARRGYALNDEELTPGLRTVAAPVFGYDGQVIGAVNVSGPSSRMTLSKIQEIVIPALLRSASVISHSMGWKESIAE